MSSSITTTTKEIPFEIDLHTHISLRTYHIKWTINNFQHFQRRPGTFIESPVFTTKTKEQSWSLRVYPNGNQSPATGYISIFLKSLFETEVTAIVDFYLINSNGELCHKKSFSHIFNGPDYGYSCFLTKAVLFDKNNGLLPNHCLTILLVLQTPDENGCIENVNCSESKVDWKPDELTRALNNTDLSDITLSVGEKDFKLHRLILSSRSPVFEAMFKHPMKEVDTKTVKITDVSPTIMEEVIRYIYTSERPNVEENAEEILAVANKYDLQGLKELCTKQLLSQLNEANAASMLVLADFYSEMKFKQKIIEFISLHARNVLLSPAWKELVDSKNNLVAEVHNFIINEHILCTDIHDENTL